MTYVLKGLSAAVITKLVGKDILNLDTFIHILHKDPEQIVNQKKTLKNLFDGSLDIIEQSYSSDVRPHNDNKRDLVYNENNILIDSIPKRLV